MNLFKICRKKQECRECCRAYGITFCQGFGRVSGRIKFIHNVSVFFGFPGHFNNTRAVVGNWSENIHSKNISRGRKHSHCGDSRPEKSPARKPRKTPKIKRREKRRAYGKNLKRG